MKKVNETFLKKHSACEEGFKWWLINCKNLETDKQLLKLVNYRADWANWLIVRLLNRKDKIRYAVFAAEQVIKIYEKKYPNDKRPRKAIEAAKKVIEKDSVKNRNANAAANAAAAAAANAAAAAAYAAADAADAAYAAADAAYAAAAAAAYAAYAAAADANAADAAAADAAANAADAAADAAKKQLQIKIIGYGISLIKK